MDSPPFSVLISTYANDDPEYLSIALESIIKQTITPTEIVLVKDGPLPPALESVVQTYCDAYPELFEIRELSENRGLGTALRAGVERCSTAIVARMDADDVSRQERFEKQLAFLEAHPDIDLVGGYIAEFEDDPDHPHHIREVPTEPNDIVERARFRSPINHGTVMFHRDAVLSAGNYREVDRMEDYDLWGRMLLDNSKLANIPEVLVDVRAGAGLYERRGGWEYTREELRQQRDFLRAGFIDRRRFALNLAVRVPGRLVPTRLRGWAYSRFFRRDS